MYYQEQLNNRYKKYAVVIGLMLIFLSALILFIPSVKALTLDEVIKQNYDKIINNTYFYNTSNVTTTQNSATFNYPQNITSYSNYTTINFSNYGAGTCTFDSGGNITSISDSKAKTNVLPFTTALSAIKSLNPVQYHYSAESGLDTQNTYVGFIAQDVEKIIPAAVKSKPDVKYVNTLKTKDFINDKEFYETVEVPLGTITKSLDDRTIIATMVNAIKEQQTTIEAQQKQIDDLKARLDKVKL